MHRLPPAAAGEAVQSVDRAMRLLKAISVQPGARQRLGAGAPLRPQPQHRLADCSDDARAARAWSSATPTPPLPRRLRGPADRRRRRLRRVARRVRPMLEPGGRAAYRGERDARRRPPVHARVHRPGRIHPASPAPNWIGRSLPLHATSSGKVFLAWLPEDERDAVLPPHLEAYTAQHHHRPCASRRATRRDPACWATAPAWASSRSAKRRRRRRCSTAKDGRGDRQHLGPEPARDPPAAAHAGADRPEHRPRDRAGAAMNLDAFITCAITGAGGTTDRRDKVPVTPSRSPTRAIEAATAGAGDRPHPRARPRHRQGLARPRAVPPGGRADPGLATSTWCINLTAGMGGDLVLGGDERPLPLDATAPTWRAPPSGCVHVGAAAPRDLHARLRQHELRRRRRLRDDEHARDAAWRWPRRCRSSASSPSSRCSTPATW